MSKYFKRASFTGWVPRHEEGDEEPIEVQWSPEPDPGVGKFYSPVAKKLRESWLEEEKKLPEEIIGVKIVDLNSIAKKPEDEVILS